MADRPLSTIQIGSVSLSPIECRAQRVVTFDMIDQVHGRPDGTAGRAFRKHQARLVEGEDYFRRNTSEAAALGITAPNGLILVAQTGYLMLVKTFRDDLAWTVQRQLVESYFKLKAEGAHTLREIGGVNRAVMNKALNERLAPIERALVMLGEKFAALHSDPSMLTSVEYRLPLDVLKEHGIATKGRRTASNSMGARLRQFCFTKGRGDWIRRSRETNRYLFHIEAVALWLAGDGADWIHQHKAKAAGQGVLMFPKRPKKSGSEGEGA